MELETRIAEEMNRNPVLEFDESEPESADPDDFPADDSFSEETNDIFNLIDSMYEEEEK